MKKQYSQSGEQEVIINFFEKKKVYGLFCDIGANDGVTFSNTRALSILGWGGILIEPSPKAFDKLTYNVKSINSGKLHPIKIALTNYDGEMILQESGSILKDKNDVSLVSTIHGHEMDRFKSITEYCPISVKCNKWSTFLENSPISKFDFISIDIEGEELNVLPDMDFDAMETKMVCIEWNSKPELKKEYDKYLSKFKVIYTSAENIIYCR